MPPKNKILNSEWKTYIDSELKKGATYRDLSKDLKSKGFSVSHTAIGEYHTRYLSNDRSNDLPPEQLPVEVGIDEIEFNAGVDAVETIKRSYKRQAQIFEHRQSLFMKGLAKFPSRELSALKDLQTVLKTHYTSVSSLNEEVAKVGGRDYKELEAEARELAKTVDEPRAISLLRYFVTESKTATPEKLLREIVNACSSSATDYATFGKGLSFATKVNTCLCEYDLYSEREEAEQIARSISHERACRDGYYTKHVRALYLEVAKGVDGDGLAFLEWFAYDVCAGVDAYIRQNRSAETEPLKDIVLEIAGEDWVNLLKLENSTITLKKIAEKASD